MRRHKLALVLFFISLLFFAFGLVAWLNADKNLRKLNALVFTDGEFSKSEYTTESGVAVCLSFGKTAVKIENSYLLKTRADRLETAAFVVGALRYSDIPASQSLSDFMGELTFHTLCYDLGILPEHTRCADLDYNGDSRFAVRFPSGILGVLGI